MGIRKKARLWTGVSTAVLLGAAACGPAEDEAQQSAERDQTPAQDMPAPSSEPESGTASAPDPAPRPAPGGDGEGAGEGGEAGGEGGEFGVDPDQARQDPVAYWTALEVIRAHYLAGKEAYAAGQTEVAGELFAHPVTEVYVDLEPVFIERGVEPFEQLMLQAADRVLLGAPQDEVEAAADAVLAAVAEAGTKAPESDASAAAVEGAILADIIERAALQYQFILSGVAGAAYVDGYGYALAAKTRAETGLPVIEAASADAAEAFTQALDLLDRAYPSVDGLPGEPVEGSALLGASSLVEFRMTALQ